MFTSLVHIMQITRVTSGLAHSTFCTNTWALESSSFWAKSTSIYVFSYVFPNILLLRRSSIDNSENTLLSHFSYARCACLAWFYCFILLCFLSSFLVFTLGNLPGLAVHPTSKCKIEIEKKFEKIYREKVSKCKIGRNRKRFQESYKSTSLETNLYVSTWCWWIKEIRSPSWMLAKIWLYSCLSWTTASHSQLNMTCFSFWFSPQAQRLQVHMLLSESLYEAVSQRKLCPLILRVRVRVTQLYPPARAVEL